MMVDHKLDRIKLGDFELVKSKHDNSAKETPTTSAPKVLDDEELLFWSSSAPALTQEQIEALSYNATATSAKGSGSFASSKPKKGTSKKG